MSKWNPIRMHNCFYQSLHSIKRNMKEEPTWAISLWNLKLSDAVYVPNCYQSPHLYLESELTNHIFKSFSWFYIFNQFHCKSTEHWIWKPASIWPREKSETVSKETFWSQCWQRVWCSPVATSLKNAAFSQFVAIACKATTIPSKYSAVCNPLVVSPKWWVRPKARRQDPST